MRFKATLLTLIAVLSPLTQSIANDKPATHERVELVGTWQIIVFQDDGRDRLARLGAGKKGRDGKPRVAKLIITKTECYVIRGDGKREMRAGLANAAWKSFKLNPSTTPRSIDIVGFAGKDGKKMKTYLGIYALKGKELKICWCEQGKKRPTKLVSDGANNLFICKRLSKKPLQK